MFPYRLLVLVRSTVLRWVRYDAASATMEIAFRSGAVYRYDSVPETVADALLAAESKGAFFNQVIRRQFTGQRVHGPCTYAC
ncbi:MAG TPA: KTSC domain-containing protein [Armatimonadaceae bacterium]|jgi:hypothetical protein|nr:KTSC domain-containing protein [Armatimonadaceae bacterium]